MPHSNPKRVARSLQMFLSAASCKFFTSLAAVSHLDTCEGQIVYLMMDGAVDVVRWVARSFGHKQDSRCRTQSARPPARTQSVQLLRPLYYAGE